VPRWRSPRAAGANFSTLSPEARTEMRARLGAMPKAVVVIVTALIVLISVAAWAYTCPVVIKQAEDLIKKAEAGKVTPETRQLIDEAKKNAKLNREVSIDQVADLSILREVQREMGIK